MFDVFQTANFQHETAFLRDLIIIKPFFFLKFAENNILGILFSKAHFLRLLSKMISE